MSDYLLVTDSIAPLAGSSTATSALGLATALASGNRRVAVLAMAAPEVLSRQPGMARRLRPVSIDLGKHGEDGGQATAPFEIPLYEGRLASSAAHLFVLGIPSTTPGRTSAVLGAAAQALTRDGILQADVVIGWGERSAIALVNLPNTRRLFVVPSGQSSEQLTAEDRAILPEREDTLIEDSLLGRAAMASDALVVPSPSAAIAIAAHPGLADRPSDQSLVEVPFGCDDPPHDPATDPALPHHFSATALAGKAECRKALARRLTLAVGPRTLLVVTPRLVPGRGTEALLAALPQLGGLDLAVVLVGGGDRVLSDRARILALENPGRMALLEESNASTTRELLGGADAAVLVDEDDMTGRAAGLALRYGALPLAPDAGAYGDFLIDYDVRSGTGGALLYAPHDAFELGGAIRRAVALRADRERWDALLVATLSSAPSWAVTAARLDSLAEEAAKAAPTPVLA
jgi:glycosyltransferase involved in cell wall biosynthesis